MREGATGPLPYLRLALPRLGIMDILTNPAIVYCWRGTGDATVLTHNSRYQVSERRRYLQRLPVRPVVRPRSVPIIAYFTCIQDQSLADADIDGGI
jgi:hypothetical protein